MPQYFSYKLNWYLPSNKLHTALNDLVSQKSNLLVDDKAFIHEMSAEVQQLNASYPRCKPINFEATYNNTEAFGESVHLTFHPYNTSFHLYKVKEQQ